MRTLREEVDLFNKKLKKLKNLDFYNLKDIDNIEEEIKKYLFDLDNISFYKYITSEYTKAKIEIINNTLNELIQKIRELN